MSDTRGGVTKRKQFTWHFDANSHKVRIENEDGRKHSYSVQEIHSILTRLHDKFGDRYFPLANNVEWLSKGTEKLGLGTIILEQENSDVSHAQGSSYLGVVLEECGYLAWNEKHTRIKWRLVDTDFSLATIESRLILTSTQK